MLEHVDILVRMSVVISISNLIDILKHMNRLMIFDNIDDVVLNTFQPNYSYVTTGIHQLT